MQYFDTQTGQLELVERELADAVDNGEELDEDDEEVQRAQRLLDEDRFVFLPERWPGEDFKIMEDFVRQKTEGKIQKALNRRRPFRHFKDALENYPQVRERYFKVKACHRQWIIEWLNSLEIDPTDEKENK